MAQGHIKTTDLLHLRQQYNQEIQKQAAENIANATNPNHTPGEVSPFSEVLQRNISTSQPLNTQTVTHSGHMTLKSGPQTQGVSFKRYPVHTQVNTREELLKVSASQNEFLLNTQIQANIRKLAKTAIGKD